MAPIPYELHHIPALERPLFIMAFKGLFDIGEAATAAVDWLSMHHAGQPAASIDPELLFDFQETRPEVRLGANGLREIHWPTNNLLWAKTPDGARDLILLSGIEPHLRWRSFGETIAELITKTGVELVATLGSTLGTIPHTRAFPVTASTSNPDLASRLELDLPTYEGPTGLIGALHDSLAQTVPALISLRVSVPHYIPGAPAPKATGALLARLEALTGVDTDHAGLADEIRDWESRVHLAIADDEEVRAYVTQLEASHDLQPSIETEDPSALTEEIENFLRERPDPTD